MQCFSEIRLAVSNFANVLLVIGLKHSLLFLVRIWRGTLASSSVTRAYVNTYPHVSKHAHILLVLVVRVTRNISCCIATDTARAEVRVRIPDTWALTYKPRRLIRNTGYPKVTCGNGSMVRFYSDWVHCPRKSELREYAFLASVLWFVLNIDNNTPFCEQAIAFYTRYQTVLVGTCNLLVMYGSSSLGKKSIQRKNVVDFYKDENKLLSTLEHFTLEQFHVRFY